MQKETTTLTFEIKSFNLFKTTLLVAITNKTLLLPASYIKGVQLILIQLKIYIHRREVKRNLKIQYFKPIFGSFWKS